MTTTTKSTLFNDSVLPSEPCKCRSLTGWGESECPVCENCRSEQLIDTREPIAPPIGEVVRRKFYLVFYCTYCEEYAVHPYKLYYDGDGDYGQHGRGDDVELTITAEEWDEAIDKADLIASRFEIRRNFREMQNKARKSQSLTKKQARLKALEIVNSLVLDEVRKLPSDPSPDDNLKDALLTVSSMLRTKSLRARGL